MALQGTLETFSLSEVVRMLAVTAKTGLLAIEGDRGVGNVWFREGAIVDALTDYEQNGVAVDVLFDLLRFSTGDFVFDPSVIPERSLTGQVVDATETIEVAEATYREWQHLLTIVPSPESFIRVVPELGGHEVVVSAESWRVIASLGGGTSAGRLRERLGLSEVDTSRVVARLARWGLVQVEEPIGLVEHQLRVDMAGIDMSPLETAQAHLAESDSDSEPDDFGQADAANDRADREPDPIETSETPIVVGSPYDVVMRSDTESRFEPVNDTLNVSSLDPTSTSDPDAPIVVDVPDDVELSHAGAESTGLDVLSLLSPRAAAALEATTPAAGLPAIDGLPTPDAIFETFEQPAQPSEPGLNKSLLMRFLSND